MAASFVYWPEYRITYAGAADLRGLGGRVKFTADGGASSSREVAMGTELGSGAGKGWVRQQIQAQYE